MNEDEKQSVIPSNLSSIIGSSNEYCKVESNKILDKMKKYFFERNFKVIKMIKSKNHQYFPNFY